MLELRESRYDRQERIWWWDQSKLSSSRVLVVGAGALGNEMVKNLCLVGVGQIDVVDMDLIEHSNLARCALFREEDEGQPKSHALVGRAASINPEVTLRAFACRVQELGSGWLRQYDLVIAGLDSREARLWVNAACRRLGKYWIDGAIEGLQGLVRVFGPGGACYECTLGEVDLAALSHRRSCAILSPAEIASGHTPTNATTASVVAGIEVQEAIKLLVDRPDLLALQGRVWRLEGESMMTTLIEYIEDPMCMAHDRVTEWADPPEAIESLAQACSALRTKSGGPVEAVYFTDDVLTIEPCALCGRGESLVGLRSVMPDGAARCANCGADRPVDSRSSLGLDDPLAVAPWAEWHWPRSELVGLRMSTGIVHMVLEGEA
ncbi:MAG: sulfur-carrier protein adenylyltransferase/sulfurtransferase [Actinomycetota bacterium]|nr:sulfur-carrier protein adenylyltransferase/sulfurtransferase [Actinomycetota bacterium]